MKRIAVNREGVMGGWWRFIAVGALAAGLTLTLGAKPGFAESRAHVYLLRGLMNIFSLGMDSLGAELSKRGIYTTVDNHADWQSLADGAISRYKAGTEGPIIIIGHSLGADAAMEMANYIGARGVPVALVVPFDGTQSLAAGPNVQRVLNLTQRDYAYMRRGAGFKGSLANVDVSSDHSIDHLNIDKSPRLHARVIGEVLSVAGGHRAPVPGTKPTTVNSPEGPAAAPGGGDGAKPDAPAPAAPAAPAKSGSGAMNSTAPRHATTDGGTPVIALPERSVARPTADIVAPVPSKPAAMPQPINSAQVAN
jgi:Thioesterase domain